MFVPSQNAENKNNYIVEIEFADKLITSLKKSPYQTEIQSQIEENMDKKMQ